MKHINLLLVLIFIGFNLFAQTGKVSSKTNIKKGILKNGLTYYIYNNPSSRGKVSYYLIQNVGAILEEDNQNGLSHFLEHMCFNGTKNFPGNTIMQMFEEKSLRRCINANTGVDKTVYHFIDVPTKDLAFCDKCLFILRDWCDGVTFSQEKIDTERLVILEEKRTRNTTQWRLMRGNIEAVLCNSKYAKRDIIGTEEVIKNVNRADFVKYYNTWYRADLQAIVVIGDVDVYETESKIKNLFSSIKSGENRKKRYNIIIPDNKVIVYKQIIEPDLTNEEIRIKFRHDLKFDAKSKYVRVIIDNMINNRINKLLKKDKDSGFTFLRIGSQTISQNYFNYGINLGYKNGNAEEILKLAIGINKDILEYGFTEDEFKKARDQIANSLEQYKKYYKGIPDKQHLTRIQKNFINKEDLLDFGTEQKLFNKVAKNLTLEDLKLKVNELYNGPNKSIVVIGKNKEKLLSKEDILRIEQNTDSKKYDIKIGKSKDINTTEILTNNTNGSEVLKKERLDIENATVWTLENGAKVVYKECNANGNVISIHAHSYGGTSLLSGDDLCNATVFPMLLPSLGIKNVKKDAFSDFIIKNKISSNVFLNNNEEVVNLNCRYENIEETFQLLYNLFENPVFYKEEYDKIIKKLRNNMEIKMNSYNFKLLDTLSKVRYGERYVPLNYDFFNKISIEGTEKIYKNRFRNAADFVFYIVGGIGENNAKKMAEKYIGSITSLNIKESYDKLKNYFPEGKTNLRLRYDMEAKKAGVVFFLNDKKDLTDKEKICFRLLKIYFKDKLDKVIRYLENGTYDVQVSFYLESKALNNYGLKIQFDCDPERSEELNGMLELTLSTIKEHGIQQADFDILKKPFNKISHSGRINKNIGYYIQVLKAYMELDKDLTDPDYNKKLLDSIDLEYINNILKEFLEKADVLDVIYLPKD